MQEEKQDLIEPLPDWKKSDLTDVTLYGFSASPPALKIKAILKYHGIPHKVIDGKKKGDAYTKVPVLLLNNRQINDSYIMVKNLSPILHDHIMTDDELLFEEEMTYGLMIALEAQLFRDKEQLKKVVSKFNKPWISCLAFCCCYFTWWTKPAADKILKKRKLESDSTDKYLEMIEDRLSKAAFLSGN